MAPFHFLLPSGLLPATSFPTLLDLGDLTRCMLTAVPPFFSFANNNLETPPAAPPPPIPSSPPSTSTGLLHLCYAYSQLYPLVVHDRVLFYLSNASVP